MKAVPLNNGIVYSPVPRPKSPVTVNSLTCQSNSAPTQPDLYMPFQSTLSPQSETVSLSPLGHIHISSCRYMHFRRRNNSLSQSNKPSSFTSLYICLTHQICFCETELSVKRFACVQTTQAPSTPPKIKKGEKFGNHSNVLKNRI